MNEQMNKWIKQTNESLNEQTNKFLSPFNLYKLCDYTMHNVFLNLDPLNENIKENSRSFRDYWNINYKFLILPFKVHLALLWIRVLMLHPHTIRNRVKRVQNCNPDNCCAKSFSLYLSPVNNYCYYSAFSVLIWEWW